MLEYSIPPDLKFSKFTDVYDYYKYESIELPITRFVRITFRGVPKDTQMSLGSINVYGIPINSSPDFIDETPFTAREKIQEYVRFNQVRELIPALDSSKSFSTVTFFFFFSFSFFFLKQ